MVESRMVSESLAAALNEQVGREFAASLRYTSIASYFAARELHLLAKLFREQADEERGHALKLIEYLEQAGAPVRIPAIPAPEHDFASAVEAVRAALQWELEVTGQFNRLMEQASRENDYLAQEFLGWFVTEQLEEVAKMRRLYQVVSTARNNLLMVEAYLVHGE
ncbi:MAG TPA: ferritin [Dehalococcoidia bacterium]|nr:ferritin [Dehalococcoidia bacterium]